MLFKLFVAVLSIMGIYLGAALFWSDLFNTALMLGNFKINGAEIISIIMLFLILRM